MASILQNILDKLQEQVMDGTSVSVCDTAWRTGTTNYPHAELIVFGGETDDDVSSVIDDKYGIMFRIRSNSREGVQIALEEIQVLWKDTTNALFKALNALGLINIQPVFISPATAFAGSTSVPSEGSIQFLMTVRYTY